MATPRKKLGELLVEAGALDPMQLQAALGHQRQWGGKLGNVLVEQGFISEPRLIEVLSTQLRVPVLRLGDVAADRRAMALVPLAMAEQLHVFPIELKGQDRSETLVVAMADPTDLSSVDQLQFKTRKRVQTVLAGGRDIAWALRRHYHGEDLPPPRTEVTPRPERPAVAPAADQALADSHLLEEDGDVVPGLVAWGGAPPAQAATASMPAGVPPGFAAGTGAPVRSGRHLLSGVGQPAAPTAPIDPFEFTPGKQGVDLEADSSGDDWGVPGLEPIAEHAGDPSQAYVEDGSLELEELEVDVEEIGDDQLLTEVEFAAPGDLQAPVESSADGWETEGLGGDDDWATPVESAAGASEVDAEAEGWLTPNHEEAAAAADDWATPAESTESADWSTPVEGEAIATGDEWASFDAAAPEPAEDGWGVTEAPVENLEDGWGEPQAPVEAEADAWGEAPVETEPDAWGETPVEAAADAWGETPVETEADAWGEPEAPVELETNAWGEPETPVETAAEAWGETPDETEANAWGEPEAPVELEADAWGEPEAPVEAAAEAWGEPETPVETAAEAWGETPVETEANAWGEPEAPVELEADAWGEPEAPVELEANAWGEPEAPLETAADAWGEPEAPVEAAAEAWGEPEAPVEAAAEAWGEAEAPLEAEAAAWGEPEAPVEAAAEAWGEPEAPIDAAAAAWGEPEAPVEAEAAAWGEAEAPLDAEAEAWGEAEAPLDAEAAAWGEAEAPLDAEAEAWGEAEAPAESDAAAWAAADEAPVEVAPDAWAEAAAVEEADEAPPEVTEPPAGEEDSLSAWVGEVESAPAEDEWAGFGGSEAPAEVSEESSAASWAFGEAEALPPSPEPALDAPEQTMMETAEPMRGWSALGIAQPTPDDAVRVVGCLIDVLVQRGAFDPSELVDALRAAEEATRS